MKTTVRNCVTLLAILFLVLSIFPNRAAADQDDPPGRVARLSYIGGSVDFEPAGTEDWVEAVVNRPLTTGDKLWADQRSRAELHLGTIVLRLDDNTGISFLSLNDHLTQVRLTAGTLYVRVWRVDDDEDIEIDTPDVAVNLTQPGVYRFHVNDAGDRTEVTVRRGSADISGGGLEFSMHRGESAVFQPVNDSDVASDFVDSPYPDDFEDWCASRDRRERLSISSRYVSRDVIGYEDLDEYGGWREVPDYGNVWFPHTRIVGWAPYRYGHWAWVWPWGWTWVDDEPWGFAPFHYGRWVVVRGVWGWVPPPARREDRIYIRPVYAPALVAWIPVHHKGLYLHFGSQPAMDIGWVPLAPREVYVPGYRVSQTYVNNVNITNTTVTNVNITNVYNNYTRNGGVTNVTYIHQSTRGAISGTSQAVFTSGEPVGKNLSYIPPSSPRAPVETAAAPSFVPQIRSVMGAGRPTTIRPPVTLENRPVVARTPPPQVIPFIRQQQEMQEHRGGPLPLQRPQPLPPQQAQQQPRYEQPERTVMQPPVRILPRVFPRTPQDAQEGRTGEIRPPVAPTTPVAPMRPVSPQGAGARDVRPLAPASGQPAVTPATPPAVQTNPERPMVMPPQGRQDRPDRPERLDRPATPPVQQQAPTGPAAVQPAPARPEVVPQDRPIVSPRVQPPTITPRDVQNQEDMDNLRRQQDLERQRVEQQQLREQQQLQQQKANEARQRAIQEQQQKQLEELERRHDQQEQDLLKKQQEAKPAPVQTQKSAGPPIQAKPAPAVNPPAAKPPAKKPQTPPDHAKPPRGEKNNHRD